MRGIFLDSDMACLEKGNVVGSFRFLNSDQTTERIAVYAPAYGTRIAYRFLDYTYRITNDDSEMCTEAIISGAAENYLFEVRQKKLYDKWVTECIKATKTEETQLKRHYSQTGGKYGFHTLMACDEFENMLYPEQKNIPASFFADASKLFKTLVEEFKENLFGMMDRGMCVKCSEIMCEM